VRVFTRTDIESLLGYPACIDEMQRAMIATSQRNCVLPLRQFMPVPGRPGKLGLMPGYLGGDDECFGVKIVSKFERPPGDPHGSHVGAVMLFAAATGLPLALIEGGTLTAIRTAAMTAAATDALARADARHLLVVGAGEEAWHHARALRCVRPFETVTVWARNRERAAQLVARLADDAVGTSTDPGPSWQVADDLPAAFALADVVCTVTSAKAPIVRGEWCRPGQHLNLVGSAIPTTAEVDDATVARGRFFVDYIDAARAAAGELLSAIRNGVVREDHVAGEIGEVLLGRVPGRRAADEITIYKSLGVTTQDLAAGHRAWREARARGLGQSLELDR
jgi:ornithine cyclodeaminase